MRKRIAILAVLTMALALALSACAAGELKVDSDNDGIHAKATNGASGSATANITIPDGYGLVINHIVEKGSFHVKVAEKNGTVVFDKDVTNNIADPVAASGSFDVVISANNAVGTIDIIQLDLEAYAQSESTLDEVYAQVPGLPESLRNDGMANPWSDVASAEEAAKVAGIDSFTVPGDDVNISLQTKFGWTFRAMKGIAQADGNVGAAEITIRKGTHDKSGDISGDYNAYAHSWTVDADGAQVKCSGNVEGATMKAIWTVGDYDYSIFVRGQGGESDNFGLNDDDLKAIVKATK